MAKIGLKALRHSYLPNPTAEADWALRQIDLDWSDGGAYALLGPSGCGKTTLLNIISGLLTPTEGTVLFDGRDVTALPPDQRNIAQVFQFPVIYDTMTVYNNLAFPLRNRGIGEARVDARVREIAEMLELTDMLGQRASGLSPDGKQKISMGRGLVREDVNVIMFDEPLTVIDPHLKWKLRSKLKELQQKVRVTMIYVTHDQTEALTFADQVVVMQDGVVVQIGTPVELFERPAHTFVGHFIGSPGMNVLPCEVRDGGAFFQGVHVPIDEGIGGIEGSRRLEIGVRPEFVRFADAGIPVEVFKVSDAGRHRIIETRANAARIHLLAPIGGPVPEGTAYLAFDPARTRLYADGWLAGANSGGNTGSNSGGDA
ncbi:MAG: ABC transporter ATP-binding protein [Proteobacteria bacterium]|nr:ABC transporter ATP-binding protein [Pseudomonadota bacterium]